MCVCVHMCMCMRMCMFVCVRVVGWDCSHLCVCVCLLKVKVLSPETSSVDRMPVTGKEKDRFWSE